LTNISELFVTVTVIRTKIHIFLSMLVFVKLLSLTKNNTINNKTQFFWYCIVTVVFISFTSFSCTTYL